MSGEITKLTLLGMNTQKQKDDQRNNSNVTTATAANTSAEYSHSREIRISTKKRVLSAHLK